MASEMYVDTIAASDGTSPATLTKQSAAKCFLQFDQSDNGVDGSLNVSSVTDNGVGDITNNFSSSFANDNYASSGFGGFDNNAQTIWVGGPASVAIGTWKTSGLLRSQATYANNTKNSDVNDFSLVHFGDLA